ncbi:MAG: MtrB/PioB family decaheme-associated outer membrane protein [Woeseiaceae bacterium]|nr:MtrB/PioB family decaheme-associated outer membrane protein [Woeseiaceae bacterium]
MYNLSRATIRRTPDRRRHRAAGVVMAVVLATAMPAFAQTPDTSSWTCESCPFPEGYSGDYTAETIYVTDDSAYLGDAGGYDEEGAYVNFAGNGSYLSREYQARWAIEDLGLDSRYLAVTGGQQGLYDYRVSYRELPRRQYDTTQTIFSPSGAGSLSLPLGWQRATATSDFPTLASDLVDVEIKSDRKLFEAGASYLPLPAVKLDANYRRIERNGVDIAAGSYFTQSSLLPRALDYSTDNVELSARLAVDRGYLVAAYYGSFFQNRFLATGWESPFVTAAGAETGLIAQAPDNRLQQVSLSGGYRFDTWDSGLSFSAAAGRATQNDVLLPYTTNDNLTTVPLPRTRLDAEVDKRNFAIAASASPLDKLRIDARFRYDRRDNNTPIESWTRVISDTFNSGEAEENVPYGFRRSNLSLDAAYRWSRELRLSGGFRRTEHDRDHQEVAEQTEDSGWGALHWRPNGRIDLLAKGGVAKREIDRYDESQAFSFGQNPLLRKYHLAYRYRRFAELTLSASGAGTPVSATLAALYADDDYTKSPLGLTGAEDLRISGDLSYAASEKQHFHLQAGYEDIRSTQAGSEQFLLPDWRARNTDRFYTAGAGMRLLEVSDDIDVTVDYLRSIGTTANFQ